jgi:hypothetical protein
MRSQVCRTPDGWLETHEAWKGTLGILLVELGDRPLRKYPRGGSRILGFALGAAALKDLAPPPNQSAKPVLYWSR